MKSSETVYPSRDYFLFRGDRMDLTTKLLLVIIISLLLMWVHFDAVLKDIKKSVLNNLDLIDKLVEDQKNLITALYEESQSINDVIDSRINRKEEKDNEER